LAQAVAILAQAKVACSHILVALISFLSLSNHLQWAAILQCGLLLPCGRC